jgi:hypothetical protein
MGSIGNTISEGHQGPAVNIAVWICFTISGLAILSKVLTKLGRQQDGLRRFSLGLDDLVISFTLVDLPSVLCLGPKLIIHSSQRPVNHWLFPDKSRRAWAHTTTQRKHPMRRRTKRLDTYHNFSTS